MIACLSISEQFSYGLQHSPQIGRAAGRRLPPLAFFRAASIKKPLSRQYTGIRVFLRLDWGYSSEKNLL